jgi:hypothetical protein
MRIFILGLFLLLSVEAVASTNWQTYGAILKGAQAKALLQQCSRATPEKVSAQWTPSKTQIDQLESKFPAFKRTLKRPKAQLSSFYRYYAGFIAGGRKIIYVDLFPKASLAWRSRGEMICDGGEHYWGVEFEIKTREFVNVALSGPV